MMLAAAITYSFSADMQTGPCCITTYSVVHYCYVDDYRVTRLLTFKPSSTKTMYELDTPGLAQNGILGLDRPTGAL